MNNSIISYISLIIFIVITICYFFIKTPVSLDSIDININKMNMYKLIGYYILVVLTQVSLNIIYVNKYLCNNYSSSKNISSAILYSIIPWSIIFGSVIIILLLFPTALSGTIKAWQLSQNCQLFIV